MNQKTIYDPRPAIHQKGFTLIEAVVSIGVVALIGFILADVMIRSFQSSDKTEYTLKLKQAGQSAINIMDKTIKTSRGVLCYGQLTDAPTTKTIVVESKPDSYTRFLIVPKTCTSSCTANGYIAQETLTLSSPVQNKDLYCQNLTDSSFTASTYKMTNEDSVNGVSVEDGLFYVYKKEGYKDIVDIYFRLGPAVKTPLDATKITAGGTVDFRTTVQIW